MKTKLFALALIPILFGCSSMTPEQKARGNQLLENAFNIGMLLIESKVGPNDGNDKANYLDGIAFGLRANESTIKNGDDVKAVTSNFAASDKAHWSELADGLAIAFDLAKGKPADKSETIAKALNKVAETQREDGKP